MRAIHYLSILAIAAVFSSCSKGDTGETGPQGPAGANGLNGANGVANINTQEYTVTSANWNATSSANTTYISTWTESDITDNNNDVVEVYWNNSSGAGWLSMPYPGLVVNGDLLSYGYNDNSITFQYWTGGTNTLPPSSYVGLSTLYFKVTVIPPAIQKRYPGTNWKNAAEVAKIPEVATALNNSGK
jgi:hypothetical protein